MPKLKPGTQLARREHILDAAERCIARSGFHRTTMQDICRDAGISPGALYVYFASKEDLIAGITERDRAEFASKLAEVADAPDLLQALSRLGEYYTIEQPREKQQICIEIGREAMHGGRVGEIYRSCDTFIRENLTGLFARALADGKIAPDLSAKQLADAISVIGDGLFWRRAVDPSFDGKTMMPVIMTMISHLLQPVLPSASSARALPHPLAAAPNAADPIQHEPGREITP